jgi:hypothetical protein
MSVLEPMLPSSLGGSGRKGPGGRSSFGGSGSGSLGRGLRPVEGFGGLQNSGPRGDAQWHHPSSSNNHRHHSRHGQPKGVGPLLPRLDGLNRPGGLGAGALPSLGSGNAAVSSGGTSGSPKNHQQPSTKKKAKKKARELDEPRVQALLQGLRDQVAAISGSAPVEWGGRELAPLLQHLLDQLRAAASTSASAPAIKVGRRGVMHGPEPEPEVAESTKELHEQIKSLQAENAKIRRYATRAKREIERLQAERKRNAAELATSEFKLREALAGRTSDATSLLEAGAKNEKTEKMKEWEKKHGTGVAGGMSEEEKLRAKHSQVLEGGLPNCNQ